MSVLILPESDAPEIVFSIDAIHAPAIRRVADESDNLADLLNIPKRHFGSIDHVKGTFWGIMDYTIPGIERPRLIEEVIMEVRNPTLRTVVAKLEHYCKGEIEHLIHQIRVQGADQSIWALFGSGTMACLIPPHGPYKHYSMGSIRLENAKTLKQEDECYEMTRISALFAQNIRKILLAIHPNPRPEDTPEPVERTRTPAPDPMHIPASASNTGAVTDTNMPNPSDFGF